MEKSLANFNTSQNGSFMFMLTAVWLILLALIALIGLLIVPLEVSSNNDLVIFLIGGFKVSIAMIGIIIWLLGWYKGLQFLLLSEFYQNNSILDSKDN